MALVNSGLMESATKNNHSIEDEFSEKIERLTKSRAYLDYCEEVYGYRLPLFNMMDRQQLDYVFYAIPVTANDTIVDLGCGAGSILNFLVTKYGCQGVGIDQLDDDIVRRTGERMTYIKGNIDRISDYGVKPTITLAIDSLYFSKDFGQLVHQLNPMESSIMYLFYSQYIFDDVTEDRSILQSQHTKIADALDKNGISFKTIDYSENERLLYAKSLHALKKLEGAFMDEGNLDLYEQKRKESMLGVELYEKNRASRYLYIIN